MKISVGTAVFNAENSIAKCVDSVASQNNADFEHTTVQKTVRFSLHKNTILP